MNLSIFHRRGLILLLTAALALSMAAAASAQQESVHGKGILVRADAVLLFADVKGCGSEPQIPSAEVLVSTDGGKTWQKHGPALEGSEFEFLHETPSGVWLAGIHVAEGPGTDPFIWVPAVEPYQWTHYAIYEGPSALQAIAVQSDGSLLAWVRHIDVHRPEWPGTVYVHRSPDGRSWTTAKHREPTSEKLGTKFEKIQPKNRNWRLTDWGDGSFSVQRKSDDGKWQDVHLFPACGTRSP